MARGGKRSGAGRKKGSTTRKKKVVQAATEATIRALTEGTTPLDVLIEAMTEAYKLGGAIAAMPYAKEAAPYVHPKLSSIAADVKAKLEHYTAQPIPVESRNSDRNRSVAGAARPAAHGGAA